MSAVGRRFGCLLAGFAFVLLLAPATRAQDDPPLLRYTWKAGEEHAFKITITIETDEATETHSGTPSYKVVSSDENGIKLQLLGSLVKSSRPKLVPGAFPRIPFPAPPPFPEFGPTGGRTLTINERGKVIVEEGETQLPYLLGDLAVLPLIALPKGNEKSWTVVRDTGISVSENSGIRHPLFDRRRERKVVKAEEESVYAIAKTEGDVITIKESYTLEALERVKGKPSMEMIGDATYTFDNKLGGPTSYESKLSLVLREGNTTTEIPITVSVQQVDPVELEAQRKAATVAAAKAKEEADAEMRRPLEPTEMAELIDDLNSDDRNRAKKALDRFAKKIPAEPDAKVSAALERHLSSDDIFARRAAANAMEHWATQDSLPALLEGLNDKDVFFRGTMIGVVGRFPGKETAEALSPLLEDGFSRNKAGETLAKMGEAAEAPVLPLLGSKDFVAQMEACKVLASVGGEKSLAALAPLTSDRNGLVQAEAKKAVEAIRKRMP